MPVAVLLGLDDTDTLDTPGTNQLARHLVRKFGHPEQESLITRHQLLEDPRVPCTRKNGCACIRFATIFGSPDEVFERVRETVLAWVPEGSDPGLCVTTSVPADVVEWGRRCQRELVRQRDARELAARLGIRLEGLGGTEDGVIGALAAIGLQHSGDDGRVVHRGTSQSEPFDIVGAPTIEEIRRSGVDAVVRYDDHTPVVAGRVTLAKKLRPNLRGGRVVLYVAPAEANDEAEWQAVKVV